MDKVVIVVILALIVTSPFIAQRYVKWQRRPGGDLAKGERRHIRRLLKLQPGHAVCVEELWLRVLHVATITDKRPRCRYTLKDGWLLDISIDTRGEYLFRVFFPFHTYPAESPRFLDSTVVHAGQTYKEVTRNRTYMSQDGRQRFLEYRRFEREGEPYALEFVWVDGERTVYWSRLVDPATLDARDGE